MIFRANLRHYIYKSGGSIAIGKDKSGGQASNNDIRYNVSVFSRSIRLIPGSLATWMTFCVFLKEMLVSLPGIGFKFFVTVILAREGRQTGVLVNVAL